MPGLSDQDRALANYVRRWTPGPRVRSVSNACIAGMDEANVVADRDAWDEVAITWAIRGRPGSR